MASQTDQDQKRAEILTNARAKIGTPYIKLDCSHFVNQAYREANLNFPYTPTRQFEGNLIGVYFTLVTSDQAKPGDLILFSGHVGIYDPDGCRITRSAECMRLEKQSASMRILSARSGKNLGVEYGQASWWSNAKFLAWKSFAPPAATVPSASGGRR